MDDPHGHIVQLYGEDEQLLHRNVSRYLREGLTRGDGILVIATADHRDAFVCQLSDDGVDAVDAIRTGRLLLIDAEAMLARFMVDGQPDWHRFEAATREAMRTLERSVGHPRLSAYGEMVGVLWRRGQRSAAVVLEEFWNRLLASGSISLFCAYPIDVFGSQFDSDTVDPLLCAHSHLVPLGDELQLALDRAIQDVLGAAAVPRTGTPARRPTWAVIPRAEEMVLWLRANLPERVDEILDRARHYQNSYLRAG
jgi:hypothetical protein